MPPAERQVPVEPNTLNRFDQEYFLTLPVLRDRALSNFFVWVPGTHLTECDNLPPARRRPMQGQPKIGDAPRLAKAVVSDKES